MATNIKYTIPFTNELGHSCRVDVYSKKAVTSTTELIGGSVPFEWEEDDDDSLLNVVRKKTGYLRFIDDGTHFADFLAEDNQSLKVMVYENETCIFIGFVQPQILEQPFTVYPREIEVPVISPLGLLEELNFDASTNEIKLEMIASIMLEIIDALDCGYASITFPRVDVTGGTDNIAPFNKYISKLARLEDNDNYFSGSRADTHYYQGKSFMFFVEGLCLGMNWILHEHGDALVFQKYGVGYPYVTLTIDQLRSVAAGNSPTVQPQAYDVLPLSFGPYAKAADDEMREKYVSAFSRINVKREIGPKADAISIDFDKLSLLGTISLSATNKEGAILLYSEINGGNKFAFTPQLTTAGGEGSAIVRHAYVEGDDYDKGVTPSFKTGILTHGSPENSITLLSHDILNAVGFILRGNVSRGSTNAIFNKQETFDLLVKIQVGDKYLNYVRSTGAMTWITDESAFQLHVVNGEIENNMKSSLGHQSNGFYFAAPPSYSTTPIKVTISGMTSSTYPWALSTFTLEATKSAIDEYYNNPGKDEVKINSHASGGEEDVTLTINSQRGSVYSLRKINGEDDTTIRTAIVEPFLSKNRYLLDFHSLDTSLDKTCYIIRWKYWHSFNYRVLARSYNLKTGVSKILFSQTE